jgi:hypothetical protein
MLLAVTSTFKEHANNTTYSFFLSFLSLFLCLFSSLLIGRNIKFYTAAILLSHKFIIAQTFLRTVDHDYVNFEMKSTVARQIIVGCWIPNNEFGLTGEAGFEKVDISLLGPS